MSENIDPSAPPLNDDSSDDTITPTVYQNENDYLVMVNELKKQFDTMKRETNLQLRGLRMRISRLIDENIILTSTNVKLQTMFMKISDVYWKSNTEWR
tara:strand:- start:5552 stop:5845 length:294 start_codon:yes stop_codon:yes gene_type:complete